jgi:uncharacterized membrane protein YedE/YeeE
MEVVTLVAAVSFLFVGLVTFGVVALLNERIGVTGGYSQIVERTTGRIDGLTWKAWFLFGVLGGALVFRLLAGDSNVGEGFGYLTRTFGENDYLAVGGLLFVGGLLVGFGAKLMGGCTSGNGLGGSSAGSPAALVATGTFMAVAIVTTFLSEALI